MTLRMRASSVAAMLGMDPRRSPLTLYHTMRGEIPEAEDNELFLEGREFEDAIARIAAQKFDFQIDLQAPLELVSRDGLIIGHPDRWFIEDGVYGVLEVKNTLYGEMGVGGWGEPGTDQVPKPYWLQAQTYAALAHEHAKEFQHPVADYALLAARLRTGTVLYRIPLDLQVVGRIHQEAREFLDRVEQGNPPDTQSEEDARNRWLVKAKSTKEVGSDVLVHLRTLQTLREQKKQIDDAISQEQYFLLSYAQEAEELTHEGRVVARLGANRKFDEAACLAAHPDLLTKYATLDTTRLGKEQRRLYERYMRAPENPLEQTRTIRIKEIE